MDLHDEINLGQLRSSSLTIKYGLRALKAIDNFDTIFCKAGLGTLLSDGARGKGKEVNKDPLIHFERNQLETFAMFISLLIY